MTSRCESCGQFLGVNAHVCRRFLGGVTIYPDGSAKAKMADVDEPNYMTGVLDELKSGERIVWSEYPGPDDKTLKKLAKRLRGPVVAVHGRKHRPVRRRWWKRR